MKKNETFKAGAEAVAKPVVEMLTEMKEKVIQDKKDSEAFAEAITEDKEKTENDSSNTTLCPSLSSIAEDKDAAIILEILKKYYLHPEYEENEYSREVISEITEYERNFSITERNYDLESLSILEEKEKCALILYTLLCLLNEVAEAYPEKYFSEIQDNLRLSKNEMSQIKNYMHDIVSTHHISKVLNFVLGDVGDVNPEASFELDRDDICEDGDENTQIEFNYHNTEDFSSIKKFIITNLEKFQDNFILQNEENNKAISKKAKYIKKEVAEEAIVGILKYGLMTNIMFTTYAFYYKEKFSDTIEISYNQLLEKGTDAIDENIAISHEDHTSFSIIIDDNLKIYFEDDNFDNDALLNFFVQLITNFTYEMLPEQDKYTLLTDMSQKTKEKYLSVLMELFENKSVYKAEVYRLVRELKCPYELICELDYQYNNDLYDMLDDLKELIPYPSFVQVGYNLFKDYIEILYRCSIYESEPFKVKKEEAETIEIITGYFGIEEPERSNFKNVAQFIPNMIFQRIAVKDFENFQKKVNKLNHIVIGGGAIYMFGLPIFGILLSLNQTNERINFYKQQKEMIDNSLQSYSDISYLLNKIDKDYYEDLTQYYSHMIELLNKNGNSVSDDIEAECSKVNGKVLNKVDKVKNSVADATADIRGEAKDIARNTAKEAQNAAYHTAKEALKFMGSFKKRKK